MKRLALLGLLAALPSLLTLGCKQEQPPVPEPEPTSREPAWFEDVTERVGLDFVHDAGPIGDYFMPQIIGSGAALFDFDNDGRLDVYLLNNGGPQSGSTNRLYRQRADGRFQDVSKGSGLDIAGHNMGVAIGDVNNDGRPDVLVTQYGGLKLFLNKGGGTFTEVGKRAGIESPLWSTSAAFFDYDRDGWLDLVVVNYVDYEPSRECLRLHGQRDYCHPSVFQGSVTKLFHNRGRQADGTIRFDDVTAASGLARTRGPGLGVACADFDGDDWPDIFVANDGKPNCLWVNQKNGTFKEEAIQRGLAYNAMGQAQAGMGIALGDVRGSGLFDVFVTHLTAETNTLWCQGPRGTFRDLTFSAGLASVRSRGTGFGTILADFDGDGALDLAVVNGRVTTGPPVNAAALGPYWSRYAERNRLWAGEPEGRFRDRSASDPVFCGDGAVSRALVVGDVDNDGAPDLLVTTVGGPARLYRNVAPRHGHWLSVRAWEPERRRDAHGAVVSVRASKRRWLRWVNPAHSYLASNDPRAHFGLGKVEQVDAVEIDWPDGTREEFVNDAAGQPIAVDRCVTLHKGRGRSRTP
jgi:hypothetical protein